MLKITLSHDQRNFLRPCLDVAVLLGFLASMGLPFVFFEKSTALGVAFVATAIVVVVTLIVTEI